MSELKLPLQTGDDENRDRYDIDECTAIYDADGEHVASGLYPVDASEIVKRVNAHDDLVRALEGTRAALKSLYMAHGTATDLGPFDVTADDYDAIHTQIDNALRKARGS